MNPIDQSTAVVAALTQTLTRVVDQSGDFVAGAIDSVSGAIDAGTGGMASQVMAKTVDLAAATASAAVWKATTRS